MASNLTQHDSGQRQSSGSDCKLFRMKDHFPDSFLVMNQLRKEGSLSDITFRVGPDSYPAHRLVMASFSPYLRAMLTCGMRESSQDVIELKEIESRAMELLIDYAYTGEVMVTVDNVQYLLPAAGILQLRDLKEACCDFLSEHMDTSNCLGIMQFADLHSCPSLLKMANRYIITKFVDVVKQEEFLNLPHSFFKELLKSDHLHVENELQVLQSFTTWVNHDLDSRSQNAMELLGLIRIHLVEKRDIDEVFETERIFEVSCTCKSFKEGFYAKEKKVKPRTPIATIYSMGGRNSQRCLNSAERYVPEDDRWEELPSMRQVRTAVAACSLGGKIYAIGGECETKFAHEGTIYLTSVEFYDPIHSVWTEVAAMKYPRSFAAATVMGDKLYAIGGETTSTCYKSVECYNPSSNAWSSLPDMHIARSGAGACSLDNKLYVVGGQDRTIHHSTMECYDPATNNWRLCSNMRHARSGVAAVVFQGCIYAIGGRDRHRQAYYDIVERYSPSTNSWESFQRLTHSRAWPAACVLDEQLYVTGGYDGQCRLKTVEKYEPEQHKWSRAADMLEYRAGCGSAVI